MGRADEFGHLVRSLIENDYMNAEVIRFDGGIRFQPKLRSATSGHHMTCGNVLKRASPPGWPVQWRAEGRSEYRVDLRQRRTVLIAGEDE
jgi:hypothetical protein